MIIFWCCNNLISFCIAVCLSSLDLKELSKLTNWTLRRMWSWPVLQSPLGETTCESSTANLKETDWLEIAGKSWPAPNCTPNFPVASRQCMATLDLGADQHLCSVGPFESATGREQSLIYTYAEELFLIKVLWQALMFQRTCNFKRDL